jgi:hypothetical protein
MLLGVLRGQGLPYLLLFFNFINLIIWLRLKGGVFYGVWYQIVEFGGLLGLRDQGLPYFLFLVSFLNFNYLISYIA